jgi:hypothetical protein
MGTPLQFTIDEKAIGAVIDRDTKKPIRNDVRVCSAALVRNRKARHLSERRDPPRR